MCRIDGFVVGNDSHIALIHIDKGPRFNPPVVSACRLLLRELLEKGPSPPLATSGFKVLFFRGGGLI